MIFSRSRKYDFQPELLINDELLEVTESTKLLGVTISSDIRWDIHVSKIRNKVLKKLWMLRRIKQLGGSIEDMILVYKLQIRCLTELACPAWNGSLSQKNIKSLVTIPMTVRLKL